MNDFEEFYRELLNQDMSDLNIKRKVLKKKKRKANIVALIICGLIDFLILISLLKESISSKIGVISMIVIWDIAIYSLGNKIVNHSKEKKEYSLEYKNKIIKNIIEIFYDDINYMPNEKMPEKIYSEPRYENYDDYYSDDYFIGKIENKYKIRMSDVLTTSERTYTDSDGDTHTETVVEFQGLFARITMFKSIDSWLEISTNKFSLFKKDNIEMDSIEFEKLFDVEAKNKIIAMQILTTDVMEQLVNFRKKMNIKFDIHIINDKIFLRFHCGSMFEEGKKLNGIEDKKLIEKYFSIMSLTKSLSEQLIENINLTEV